MTSARDCTSNDRFDVNVGDVAVGILRPGERFGSGDVPEDRDTPVMVDAVDAGITLDADDLAPGTILWIVDPTSHNADGDGRWTAWPSVVEG